MSFLILLILNVISFVRTRFCLISSLFWRIPSSNTFPSPSLNSIKAVYLSILGLFSFGFSILDLELCLDAGSCSFFAFSWRLFYLGLFFRGLFSSSFFGLLFFKHLFEFFRVFFNLSLQWFNMLVRTFILVFDLIENFSNHFQRINLFDVFDLAFEILISQSFDVVHFLRAVVVVVHSTSVSKGVVHS